MAQAQLSPVSTAATPEPAWQTASVLVVFSVSLFLSAMLLFSVQPMFTKMVLPLLGGSPAVWNTAVVFFQAVLLAGYLYAHLLSRFLGLRVQALIHVALFLCAFAVLPVAVATGWEAPRGAMPTLWLIGLMAVSIGLPLFVVSANAPLLQNWFSFSGHRYAADPYFLYGASNLGSLLALAGYITLMAPSIGLERQGEVWTWGFSLLALLVALCAVMSAGGNGGAVRPLPDAGAEDLISRVGWGQRVRWLLLSFAPASLMLGVTLHISTDIAAAPFLWVIPLAIYLSSFVLVFARRPLLKHEWMIRLQVFVLIPLAIYFWVNLLWLVFALHLAGLFVTAMVCHGELARQRPVTRHLTEFYLWMSFGGLLGGVFSSLLAPVLFDSVIEYPLALVLACLLRPLAARDALRDRIWDILLPAVLGLVMLLPYLPTRFNPSIFGETGRLAFFAGVAVALYLFRRRPARFGLGIAAILLAPNLTVDNSGLLAQERSFFGVYRVEADGKVHMLRHGTTTHGIQMMEPLWRRTPLSYYGGEGPLGQLFDRLNRERRLTHMAAVGLGVGTVACYRRSGQTLTFYEIDPTIERLARDARLFRYLSDCGAGVAVRIGDGRRAMASAPDGKYDLMVLDAFSSDAIPTHLITREALALYLRKLSERGVIAFHISNNFVDLEPVLADLVAEAGLAARIQSHIPAMTDPLARQSLPGTLSSVWVAVGRTPHDLAFLADDARWKPLRPVRGRPWSDDYADVFSALIWARSFDANRQSRGPEMVE